MKHTIYWSFIVNINIAHQSSLLQLSTMKLWCQGNAPHGRWSDDVGACICEAPYHGEDCEEKHCAGPKHWNRRGFSRVEVVIHQIGK